MINPLEINGITKDKQLSMSKKHYVGLEINPVDMELCGCILAGSETTTKIAPQTVEVEEYVEAFNSGFDISFED